MGFIYCLCEGVVFSLESFLRGYESDSAFSYIPRCHTCVETYQILDKM
jgi:hypothetical protein